MIDKIKQYYSYLIRDINISNSEQFVPDSNLNTNKDYKLEMIIDHMVSNNLSNSFCRTSWNELLYHDPLHTFIITKHNPDSCLLCSAYCESVSLQC